MKPLLIVLISLYTLQALAQDQPSIFPEMNSMKCGQLSGGGELNPDLKAPKKAQEEFMDRKIGLSVHWGPSSLGGKEISWSRGKQIETGRFYGLRYSY